MATAPTQIRIDADIKKQATDLFNTLGLDMSGAVNLFNVCLEADFHLILKCPITISAHLMPWMKPNASPVILTSRDIIVCMNCEGHLKNKCTQ